jgi:carboxyl-terminal processing protease
MSRSSYSITRARIDLEDSAAHGEVFEVGSKPDGTALKIGVVDLPSFYLDMEAAKIGETNGRSATKDVEKILRGFRAARGGRRGARPAAQRRR